MEDYLNKLNAQQRDAVLYCDGPQLVIAGAGSGKTRVLTYKIVHLLKLGYLPSHIMALTFTNKAAGEMRERITALVGDEASHLWMGTFHSIFAKLLRINADRIGFNHDFTIYDTSDSRSLLKLIIKDMQLDDKVYKPAAIQSRISMMKNALITPSYYEQNNMLREEDERANRPLTFDIYKTYCHRCKIAYERYHCQKEMSFDCHQMNRSHIIIILSGMHIFFHCNRYPLRPRNVLAGTEMHRLEPLFRCGNYHLILRYEIRIGTIVESNRLDFVPTQGNACNQKKLLWNIYQHLTVQLVPTNRIDENHIVGLSVVLNDLLGVQLSSLFGVFYLMSYNFLKHKLVKKKCTQKDYAWPCPVNKNAIDSHQQNGQKL